MQAGTLLCGGRIPFTFAAEHSKTANILLLKYLDSRLFLNESGYVAFCKRKTQITVKRESSIIEVTMVDERFRRKKFQTSITRHLRESIEEQQNPFPFGGVYNSS